MLLIWIKLNITIENGRIVKMDILKDQLLLYFKNKSDKKRNPKLS